MRRRQPDRREFMAMLGGVLAGVSSRSTPGQVAPENRAVRRIDVHHHILPPDYIRLVGEQAIGRPGPNGKMPAWDVSSSLRALDEAQISTAIVSVSAPWVDDSRVAERLAPACNDFAARMTVDHPSRFGFFATLPMPNVQASLRELARAVDQLHCDGVCFMTNYKGKYLGDPVYAPIFGELNRRRLPVYVHPTVCGCDTLEEVPASMIDFPHDTTRTVVSLLSNGTFVRCPDIRFIFSHAGGTVPFLATRIANIGGAMGKPGWLDLLRKLHYDTALSATPTAFVALLKLVDAQRILFGTDYPFAGAGAVTSARNNLAALGLTSTQLQDIEGENAVRLFAR